MLLDEKITEKNVIKLNTITILGPVENFGKT